MSGRRVVRFVALAVVSSALWAGTAQASSIATTSVGLVAHRFVRVVTVGGHATLQVTAGAKRRYHGRWLEWMCTRVSDRFDGISGDGGGGGDQIVADVQPLRVDAGSDYCLMQVVVRTVRHSHHRGVTTVRTETRHLRQAVAITAKGRAVIARVRGAQKINAGAYAVRFARDGDSGHYPAATKIVADLHKVEPDLRAIALDAPEQPAPRGTIGIWTNGATRYRVAFGLADGTQLFYDKDTATGLLTTNVQDALDVLRDPGVDWWYDYGSGSIRSSSSASRR
jgi:hypothetical protein